MQACYVGGVSLTATCVIPRFGDADDRICRITDDRSNGFGVRSAPLHPVGGQLTAPNVDQFSVAVDSTDA